MSLAESQLSFVLFYPLNRIMKENLNTSSEKQKIVIIGAGLAGLTTAYRLFEKGYDIEIYEARPRVGGRIHSVLSKVSKERTRSES